MRKDCEIERDHHHFLGHVWEIFAEAILRKSGVSSNSEWVCII
jgi:hypothetical protein